MKILPFIGLKVVRHRALFLFLSLALLCSRFCIHHIIVIMW